MKHQKKKDTAVVPATGIEPVVPWWIFGGVFLAWAFIVLSRYFGIYPPGSFGILFAGQQGSSFFAFLHRAGESAFHFGVVLALCVSALGIGGLVTGRFFVPGEPQNGRLFIMWAAGMGTYALSAFLLGMAGLLNPLAWGAGMLLLFAAGIHTLRKQGLPSFLPGSLSGWEKAGVIVVAFIGLINLLGACCPELFYDAQYYQTGIPLKWILDHKITTTEYMSPTFFPFNVNMLFMIAQLMGNDITAKMVPFICGIGVCWGIYLFGARFFSREVGVLAALIFYAVPQVMIGSWKAAIELGIAVFELATMFSLMYYFVKRERFWLIIAGVFCGLSMGSKYTGLVFCFMPSVMTIAGAGVLQRQGVKPLLRDIALFSLAAVAVCAPWYIRNFIDSGNPVFPFLWDKIGFLKLKMTRSLFSDPPRPPFSFYNYFCFLWPMTMGTLQQETMLGPLFLVFVPFVFLFRKIDVKIKILGVYVLTALVFWAVLGRFYARYLIPTLPVISVIFAYYIASHGSRAMKNISYLLILGIALANSSYGARVLQVMQAPMPYFTGAESRKDYLSRQKMGYPTPYYPVLDYANKNLDPDAVILFVGETRGLFSERRFIISGAAERSPLADWLKESSDADQLYARMRAQGVTHILLNVPEAMRLKGYDILYWSGRDALVLAEFWNKYVREVYRDIADVEIPQRGIRSLKNDAPERWRQYASSAYNYVFLYKIVPGPVAAGSPVPHNFFLDEPLYSATQWQAMTAGPEGQRLMNMKGNN